MIKPAKAGFFVSGVCSVNAMVTPIHAWMHSVDA